MRACIHECMQALWHTFLVTYAYTCTCVHACALICTLTNVHTRARKHTHTHTHTHTHIFSFIGVCTPFVHIVDLYGVCVCVCVCVWKLVDKHFLRKSTMLVDPAPNPSPTPPHTHTHTTWSVFFFITKTVLSSAIPLLVGLCRTTGLHFRSQSTTARMPQWVIACWLGA